MKNNLTLQLITQPILILRSINMGFGQSRVLQDTRKRKLVQRQQIIKKSLEMLEKIIANEKITKDQIDRITRLPLEKIVDELNNLKITSKQLTAIFSYRAATIGLRLNLITEVNFQDSIIQAQKCDEIRRSTKKRNWTFQDPQQKIDNYLPPLFGIPISIKDTIDMKGLSSTIGITHRAFDKKQDGVIISTMKQGGLIPFTKSNVPQLAMIFDCYNYLWGRGMNPWNQLRSIGGSSGGQGGLVAARCSVLGVGSDVGGSIRIPAEFCGVYGLKPSDSRLGNNYQTDYATTFSGMDTLQVVIGPLSNSVQGLALWMKTVTTQANYKGLNDPYNKNIPFDTKTYKEYQTKKLRIGYVKSMQIIESTKSSQRAIQQTIRTLQSLGHELFPVQIPNQRLVIRAFYSEFAAQGQSRTFIDMLKGQPFTPEYNQVNTISSMNSILFWIAKAVYNRTAPRLGFLLEGSGKKTVHQYLQHAGKVIEFRQQLAKFWREKKLDFIIMPGFGSQACLHGYSETTSLAAAYTFMWNVLGTTVGSVPVTVTREDEEVYESRHNDVMTTKLKQSAIGSAGMPVGIQVIGLPFEDEKVLGLMKVLEKELRFYEKFPLPNIQ